MKTISQIIGAQGRYLVCRWKPGVVGGLLNKGFSLDQARRKAVQSGALIGRDRINNIVVSSGLNLIALRLIGTSLSDLTWHAIGTGATAVFPSDSALVTEAKRLALATRSISANVATLTVFYWASESTFHIKELGIFGGAATSTPGSGTLFSRALYDYDNSAGSVDLTFDYVLTLTSL